MNRWVEQIVNGPIDQSTKRRAWKSNLNRNPEQNRYFLFSALSSSRQCDVPESAVPGDGHGRKWNHLSRRHEGFGGEGGSPGICVGWTDKRILRQSRPEWRWKNQHRGILPGDNWRALGNGINGNKLVLNQNLCLLLKSYYRCVLDWGITTKFS